MLKLSLTKDSQPFSFHHFRSPFHAFGLKSFGYYFFYIVLILLLYLVLLNFFNLEAKSVPPFLTVSEEAHTPLRKEGARQNEAKRGQHERRFCAHTHGVQKARAPLGDWPDI